MFSSSSGALRARVPVDGKGDYLTMIPVKNEGAIDNISIFWSNLRDEWANFEIQTSGGNGQFPTVFSGTASGADKMQNYKFAKTTASDICVLIVSGKAAIADVKIDRVLTAKK